MPLRPDTQAVWDVLQAMPALRGFCLVGGSALTLRIDHRVSEDLNLAFPAGDLPPDRLARALRAAANAGLHFQKLTDAALFYEWQNDGLNLDEAQQNYVVNGAVKLSFFAPPPELRALLQPYRDCKLPQVISLRDAFRSKCVVCADRSRSRDWFDLYILLTQHGFTAQDFLDAFQAADAIYKLDIALMRMVSGKPDIQDEGYASLIDMPVGIDDFKRCFIALRDQVEQIAVAPHSGSASTGPAR